MGQALTVFKHIFNIHWKVFYPTTMINEVFMTGFNSLTPFYSLCKCF